MPQNTERNMSVGVEPFCLGLLKTCFSILNKSNLTYVLATSDFWDILKHLRKSWKNWIFHEKSWFSIDDEFSISHKICGFIIKKIIFCLKKEKIKNFQKKVFYAFLSKKNDFLAQKVKKRIFEKNRFFAKCDIKLRVQKFLLA